MPKRRFITLDEETDSFLEDFKIKHGIRYNGDAIAKLVSDYKALEKKKFSIAYITEVVSNQMKQSFQEELKKIRLASNSSDKNTQVLIELMNGVFFLEGYNNIISTNDAEAEGLKMARQVVQDRISHGRQRKLDAEAKNKTTNTIQGA